MTLTLDLEKGFKVTAHPLPKGILWVRYKPDLARGEKEGFSGK